MVEALGELMEGEDSQEEDGQRRGAKKRKKQLRLGVSRGQTRQDPWGGKGRQKYGGSVRVQIALRATVIVHFLDFV
jgi:hypothetical protein